MGDFRTIRNIPHGWLAYERPEGVSRRQGRRSPGPATLRGFARLLRQGRRQVPSLRAEAVYPTLRLGPPAGAGLPAASRPALACSLQRAEVSHRRGACPTHPANGLWRGELRSALSEAAEGGQRLSSVGCG